MDWIAPVLISLPLAWVAFYYLLRGICHRQRLGYTQIVTSASSQIQICEQRETQPQDIGNSAQGLEKSRTTSENDAIAKFPRRPLRPKPTFVKLLRPLPVKPVCTSNEIKVNTTGHQEQHTFHISEELSQDQNVPVLAERESEEDDQAQNLCPVCQIPLRQRNWTGSSYPTVPHSSWSGREQLQTYGAAPTAADSSQQVICSACWPLVGKLLM